MSDYRSRLKKKITLPSGEEVTISKLNALNAPFLEKRAADSDQTAGIRMTIFVLTNKVSALGGRRIVETVTDDDKEIGVTEIEQEDIDCIVNEVMEFSGLTKRAEEARKTFPEAGAQNGNHSAQPGEAVSRPSADAVATASA